MTLDSTGTLALAAAILLAGRFLNAGIAPLARYNIPQPISGGLAFALLAAAAHAWSGLVVETSATLRPPLLLAFFATVGLSADLGRLRKGGPKLALFLGCVVPFLMLQNAVGTGLAILLDQHPLIGLIGGSVTLVGGHGTGAAYARIFEDTHSLAGVMGLAMASATIGLVLGGVVGGPVAQYLLRGQMPLVERASGTTEVKSDAATTEGVIVTTCLVLFCLLLGGRLATLTQGLPVALPDFLWCLFVGVVVRNLVAPALRLPMSDVSIDLVGSTALALFLALTMATIRLWELAALAGPLMAIVAAQAAFAVLFATLVVYRVMGRDYEAAVATAGFVGFSMGATATAIANMQAVANRYGPAPVAFLVVPLTGAFFIDLANALVLTGAITLPVFGE
ncbi:sodium/glutamate symporter [Falsiroseomonas bella]|uniref:Sodium/glutamate symporter n=1 Tax=Falsiroseomonas bella TaxID=2184016 RepID=A0A317FAJ8_9PROT|nr:sodium/glutamate symporter [Falsiroseomonas bella]PWS36094.1 sodium/glutamate symporter [Falsiroseomonas bella]